MSNKNYELLEPFIEMPKNKKGVTIPTNKLKTSLPTPTTSPTNNPNSYTELDKNIIVKLIQQYYPIVYFHKDEPYMPIDYDNLLQISNLSVLDNNYQKVNDITTNILDEKKKILANSQQYKILIEIDENKKYNNPVAKQLITKTDGFWYNPDTSRITIEIVFYYIFSWNGTIDWHPFDTEQIIIRLFSDDNGKTWDIAKVFGSAHGNGRWFRKYEPYWWNADMKLSSDLPYFEGNHPVMFSAVQSHTMYSKPEKYKRIFLFGNDYAHQDTRYVPSEFVLMYKNDVYSINDTTNQLIIRKDYNYFLSNSLIGQYKKNFQPWVGSDYCRKRKMNDTLFLDAYYKFQGGIDDIFTGDNAVLNNKIKLAIKIISIIIWSFTLIFLIYYTFKIYDESKILFRILFVLRNMFAYIFFSFIVFFMFLLIFIVNDY
jgi:hypothetical protein